MDISSLPEAEQQQLLQLQQQFQQHQHEQQQQQQQLEAAQAQSQQQQQQQQYYDPALASQPYDPSSYYSSYYQNYYAHPSLSFSSYQPQPPFYAPDYSAAAPSAPADYPAAAAAAAAYQGISAGDGTAAMATQQQQQQGGAYSLGQGSVSVTVPPSLNPAAAAAVAALSQLTQFAGTMDAAERAMAGLQPKFPGFGPGSMHPSVGQQQYRGGGPFQGFVHHTGPLQGRKRGRGKVRSRRNQPQGATSKVSYPEPPAPKKAESTEIAAESSAGVSENAAQSASAGGKITSNRRAPQIAWCELCRVDCTSLEILEQHKNGKRHKKNLLRIEELKKVVKPGVEIQNVQEPENDSKPDLTQQPEMPEIAQKAEKQQTENLSSEIVSNERGLDAALENNTEEKPNEKMEESSNMQVRKPRMDAFGNRKRGMKSKMMGGRGGKRVRTFETPRRPIEPPKPKVVIPLMCDLCNVKCDTQEVLNRHLSGKKHIAKLKRFEGHQAMYGSVGLQALYPPNPMAQTRFTAQGNQPFYDPQGSFHTPGGSFPSQAAMAAVNLDNQFVHNSIPQQSEATYESGGNNVAQVATGDQQQVANVGSEH